MAPEVDRQKVRRQCAPNARTASNRDGCRGTGGPVGGGKPRLGLPPHPGCTRQSGTRVGTWHHRQHSEASRHRASPERSRKTTWGEFLSRHWEQIVASDFFTVEVWT